MAIPEKFPQANDTLKAPKGAEDWCGDLTIFRGVETAEHLPGEELPVIVSAWRLTPEELAEVNKTSIVWLKSYGHTHPPISVTGKTPFFPDQHTSSNQGGPDVV